MMKNNLIKYMMLAGLVVGLASCNDLDRFPKDKIGLDQSFQSISDASKWDKGLYADLRGRVYNIYTYSTDVQADQLNATQDYGNRNGFPHRWTGFLSDDYTIRDVWAGYYWGITVVNKMLEGFENINPKNANETSQLNQFKGDAYLARAYYYFNLMLRYAKPYNSSTASSDPGVPLVLKYDINVMPERATSAEVYKQILDDINQASSLLSNVSGGQGSHYFNKDVVMALKARVALNMKDWATAESAANALINSGTYPLISDAVNFKKMWVNDFPQEDIFQCFVNKPDELPPTNNIYLGYNVAKNYYDPDFIPSQWVVDAYADNDIRKGVYFNNTFNVHIQGNDYQGIYLVNKFPGNPALWTAASTNYAQAPKVFRIAEMYLISAEAAANQNKDLEAATTLNTLRIARGLDATSATGATLMDSIKLERFRELAFEGFRLNDLERWNDGFTRHDPQNMNIIMVTPSADFYQKSVQANDPKFVWAIPSHEVTINPNLKGHQNAGW